MWARRAVTVERHRPWGGTGGLAADDVVATHDAGARAVVDRARRAGAEVPVVGLVGGDLCRTLGGRGDADRLRDPDATRVRVDVVEARLDGGRPHWFVAHLVARRSWWWGPVAVAMNAEFLGRWDVAPRGHPGDGRVEVLEADPALRTRAQIRGRLASGTHLPHPAIGRRTVEEAESSPESSFQLSFECARTIHLDGERVGRATTVGLRVEPDALRVVV